MEYSPRWPKSFLSVPCPRAHMKYKPMNKPYIIMLTFSLPNPDCLMLRLVAWASPRPTYYTFMNYA